MIRSEVGGKRPAWCSLKWWREIARELAEASEYEEPEEDRHAVLPRRKPLVPKRPETARERDAHDEYVFESE